jgi:hypothetical protein
MSGITTELSLPYHESGDTLSQETFQNNAELLDEAVGGYAADLQLQGVYSDCALTISNGTAVTVGTGVLWYKGTRVTLGTTYLIGASDGLTLGASGNYGLWYDGDFYATLSGAANAHDTYLGVATVFGGAVTVVLAAPKLLTEAKYLRHYVQGSEQTHPYLMSGTAVLSSGSAIVTLPRAMSGATTYHVVCTFLGTDTTAATLAVERQSASAFGIRSSKTDDSRVVMWLSLGGAL